MQRHRGLFSGLVMGVLLGLMGNQAQAGAIRLSVDLNGETIFAVSSTRTDQFVNAPLAGLNAALTAAGSAYQFTAVWASPATTPGIPPSRS